MTDDKKNLENIKRLAGLALQHGIVLEFVSRAPGGVLGIHWHNSIVFHSGGESYEWPLSTSTYPVGSMDLARCPDIARMADMVEEHGWEPVLKMIHRRAVAWLNSHEFSD